MPGELAGRIIAKPVSTMPKWLAIVDDGKGVEQSSPGLRQNTNEHGMVVTKIGNSHAAVNSVSTDVRLGNPLGGEFGEATGRAIGAPSVDVSVNAEIVSGHADIDITKRDKGLVSSSNDGKHQTRVTADARNGLSRPSSTSRSNEHGGASEADSECSTQNNKYKNKQAKAWQRGAAVGNAGGDRATLKSEAITRSLIRSNQKLQGESDALKELLAETEELVSKTLKVEAVERPLARVANWSGARQYVRLQFHKLAASDKRIHSVFSNVNYVANKFELTCDEDYADKLDAMIYEEAGRPVMHWSAWLQYLHDEYRRDLFDFKARFKRQLLFVTCGTLAVGITACTAGFIARRISVTPFRLACLTGALGLAARAYSFLTRNVLRITRRVQWEDTCCEGAETSDIDSGNAIDTRHIDGVCKPAVYYVGMTICFPNLVTYRGCYHNEEIALRARQLIRKSGTPGTRKIAWQHATALYLDTQFVRSLPDFSDVTPSDVELFLSRYPAGRRNYLHTQLERADGSTNCEVSGFVKTREILPRKALAKSHPRFITNYPDTFLLNTIPFWVWQKRCVEAVTRVSLEQNVTFTSGLDPLTIGEWVACREQDGYYFYELDGSRFDGRVAVEAKQMLSELYRRKQLSGAALRCFEATESLSGRTKHGIRFTTDGTVGSGRIDTSAGDSHITAATIGFAMARLGVDDWHVMINGDDNVLAVRHMLNLEHLIVVLNSLGHDMEVIFRPNVNKLEYCSGRFWPIGSGRRVLGPKLGRLLGKGFMIHTPISRTQILSHLVSVGKGYYHYRWLPGLDTVLESLGAASFSSTHRLEFQTTLAEEVSVDPVEVHDAFLELYGFEPDLLRDVLRGLPFSTIPKDGGLLLSHPLLDHMAIIDGMCDPCVECGDLLSRWL